jgi:hypothetical protein
VHGSLNPHVAARHCVVCNAVLPRAFGAAPQARDPYPTCQTVACRMVASRRADMGEAVFKHYLDMQARHTRHRASVAQAALQDKADEAAENAAAFAALRARLPQALEREPLHLLLPSGPRRAGPLSRRRRERYRQHLEAIIAEATTIASAPPAVQAASSSGSTLIGKVCATCGGGCCTRGAEKAYLSAQTMRRVMDARPGISDEELLASYLDRLGAKTQAGSCINHTAQGCSLPPDLRSDICNRFSCESLAKLQAAQRGPEPVHAVLIVRRKQDHWHRNELAVDNRIIARALLQEAEP